MATDKQIGANRQNAQLCTGPKTEEGRETLDELIADFHTRFAPATPEERSLVDALIRYEWLSRRYMAADTAVWNGSLLDETPNVGRAFVWHSETLARARYFNTARKGFSSTLKELQVPAGPAQI